MRITIDGRPIQVEGRPTLLEIARKNNIFIPSLCDYPGLTPFTGCRLCLVGIKGRRDYAPACGTYPEEGMEVTTETPDLRELRKGILELILSEHPYACLICGEKSNCDEAKATIRKVGEVTGCVLCPRNGRCDFQRLVADLGIEAVRHPALYKNLDVRREDPFFDRDPNTCILCGKCVRVCNEIRAASVLTFVSRGSHTVVGTALDRSLLASGCQFCGACVDVCPTAALVERAVRPQLLPEKTELLICPFCSQGCLLEAAVLKDKVLFTRPAESGPVNCGQACVRGRFLIRDTLHSGKRIDRPWIRKNGTLVEAEWDEALDVAAARLKEAGPGRAGVGFSRQLGLEDAYALLKFAGEALRTGWISTGPETPLWNLLGSLIEKHKTDIPLRGELDYLADADVIVNFGVDLPQAQPMAWLRVAKAVGKGSRLLVVGSGYHAVAWQASLVLKTLPGTEYVISSALASELVRRGTKAPEAAGFRDFKRAASTLSSEEALEKAGVSQADVRAAVGIIAAAKSPAVLCDLNVGRGPRGALNLAAVWNFALLTGSRFVPLGAGSNDRGISEIERATGSKRPKMSPAGLRDGLRTKNVTALVLAGAPFELGDDRPDFLICLDTHWNPLVESADIVLPSAAFAENDATLVNTEGRIQTGRAVIPRFGTSRPDREIVAALAARMGAEGFDFADAQAILEEISRLAPALREALTAGRDRAQSAFVRESSSRPPRFLPLAPPPESPQAGSEYPLILSVRKSGDSYRNFEAARMISGLGRLRPPGLVFLHPADMEAIGVEENGEVEILSASGRLAGTARTSRSLRRGAAETALSGMEPGAGEFLAGGIVPVNIRRKI